MLLLLREQQVSGDLEPQISVPILCSLPKYLMVYFILARGKY